MKYDPSKNYPLNPDYGQGIYRRRIRLTATDGCVLAELEDCNHGFRCRLYHDGQRVTDVVGEALRVPLNTCPGAVEPLKLLIGRRLSEDMYSLNKALKPTSQCTHLYDLSLLAMRHAGRGEAVRQYDIEVDDEQAGGASARLLLDGEPLLEWQVQQWSLLAPAELVGNTLQRGFSAWASKHYSDDLQEAAFALQKGYFVAQARIFDVAGQAGSSVLGNHSMHGVCFSYSSPQLEQARCSADSVRDFTDGAEDLLKFV